MIDKIILLVMIIGFGTSIFSAPFILNAVYGIESSEIKQFYYKNGTEVDSYNKYIINFCSYTQTPNMIVFDSRGLKDTIFDLNIFGVKSHHNDKDLCKLAADLFLSNDTGWTLHDVDRSDGETVITLIK